ncbi:hypothetical protein VKT23_002833 [Stygiomarasmius scandens]|uniref:Uncharacterized protein n=1 Tax=Marasmiellus scandens TaxID=2682957 RepID=A0ABR1K138_9AGAR
MTSKLLPTKALPPGTDTGNDDGSTNDTSTPNEDKIAVYSFHPFTDVELAEIVKVCEKEGFENGGNEDFIAVAPKPYFLVSEAEVDKVVAYHRELKNQQPGYWDPNHFIIAKSPEWKKEGVMIVVLNEYSLAEVRDDGIAYRRGWDAWMFTAESSGLTIINLQIANANWTEFTTSSEGQPGGQEVDQRSGKCWEEIRDEEA